MTTLDCDYLIIGSGIAGLVAAHHLSRQGRVIIATKKEASNSSTNWAQGGISCVVGEKDSFAAHVDDTCSAGAGICNRAVVEDIVSAGPAAIAELEQLGVLFEKNEADQSYDLGKEGGTPAGGYCTQGISLGTRSSPP